MCSVCGDTHIKKERKYTVAASSLTWSKRPAAGQEYPYSSSPVGFLINLHIYPQEARMEFTQHQLVEIIQTIFIILIMEGILSVDNSSVIAAMASRLPDQPVAAPQRFQKLFDRLGNQQEAARKIGIIFAYVGRFIMLIIASALIDNIAIRLFGALYLIKLAVKHLSVADQPGETKIIHDQKVPTFWGTVATIIIMDMTFSLDNVVTAVGINDELWIVLLGVGFGIITLMFTSGWAMKMIKQEPRYEIIAYLLILEIGTGLFLETIGIVHIEMLHKFVLSLGTIMAVVIYIKLPQSSERDMYIIEPWGHIFGNVNETLDSVTRLVIRYIKFILTIGLRTLDAIEPPRQNISIE